MIQQLIVLACMLGANLALDNGLALTPPMGFMSWERYRCIVDCVNYPNECISEKLFKKVADLIVSEGYADVGYEYVIIDDCWPAHQRDAEGKLQPNATRFPSGLKHLSDYIHSKGLKFGLYEDYGNYTCGGYPGVLGHLETDANSFAAWGVDYVKLDGCYAKYADMQEGYIEFGNYLNKTGRPMVYSCSWPAYMNATQVDYEVLQKTCNSWRNYDDIADSWGSVVAIMNWFGKEQDLIARHAGPGHWNDPDMLIVGDYGLSYDESKAQMAVWAVLAAPLLLSVDLAAVAPRFKAILQNRDVIAVNQDPLGVQGLRVSQVNNIDVWTRCVTPKVGSECSYAVAIVSRRTDGNPVLVSYVLKDIGLNNSAGYNFTELYDGTKMVLSSPNATLVTRVNPSGVAFYKATAIVV
ncbi:alpha-N-acetylgalactosaminidase [Bacillus rossius redtenbacheri]|uniref:alpha-N-acetylgalactosaminidase n=1 Tax=Bacillus rossius redtenbacheri TaxID=93214 RepID=UPI002FDE9AD8